MLYAVRNPLFSHTVKNTRVHDKTHKKSFVCLVFSTYTGYVPDSLAKKAICSKGRAKVEDEVGTKRGVNAQRLVFMYVLSD